MKLIKESIITKRGKRRYRDLGENINELTPQTKIKDYIAQEHPTEFQLDRINPDITFGELYKQMRQGKNFYELASVDGEGFDSAVREYIFDGISEVLGVSYDHIYNVWVHPERYVRKSEEDIEKTIKEDFNYIRDIDDAQYLVDNAIERFGRIGAELYDELDEAGFYIDNDNKVKHKVEPKNESLYQTKSLTSGNKMSYELKDDGTLIVKDGDKEIFNVKVSNIEQAREQFKNMDNIETIKEDVSPEVKQDNLQDLNDSNVTTINDTSDEAPTPKDNGIAALLIDSINGEWDTIKLYNDLIVAAESYGYPDIADVIRDINKEENLHVGQLQTALETISPVTSAIDEGSIEAESQLSGKEVVQESVDKTFNSVRITERSNAVYSYYFNFKQPVSKEQIDAFKADVKAGDSYLMDIKKRFNVTEVKKASELIKPTAVISFKLDDEEDPEEGMHY